MILRGLNWGSLLTRALRFAPCLFAAGWLAAQSPQQTAHPPTGWFLAGTNPKNYQIGVDRTDVHGGLPSAYLTSLAKGTGFGTLMQSINAANYAGKRIRLRGWVKSQDVGDWAGLWMRVDKGQKTVAFDNMQNRGIKGTQLWNSYDIVLDVPTDATSIHFGILLSGAGEVWLNDLSLEVVKNDTPTTAAIQGATLPDDPVNLSFNE